MLVAFWLQSHLHQQVPHCSKLCDKGILLNWFWIRNLLFREWGWFDFPSFGHFVLNPRKQKDQHPFQAMFCLSLFYESRGDLALLPFQSKLSQYFILLFLLQFFHSLGHSYHFNVSSGCSSSIPREKNLVQFQ